MLNYILPLIAVNSGEMNGEQIKLVLLLSVVIGCMLQNILGLGKK